MPARNSARYIKDAIDSVLREHRILLELIVVDDGSVDDTAAVVNSIGDPRIRLLRNNTPKGIGYCHNLIIRESSSPFIAHVDSDDIVVEGALAKLVGKIESDERLGQVHCFSFDIKPNGEITRDEFIKRRHSLLELHRNGMDYKQMLMEVGMVANHLRTYRREVFDVVGGFEESLQFGEDYEMSLRIADVYDVAVVPEMLYGHRLHDANSSPGGSGRIVLLRCWLQCARILWRAKREGKVRFLHDPRYSPGRSLTTGLGHLLGLTHLWFAQKTVRAKHNGVRGALKSASQSALGNLYYWTLNRLSWWPTNLSLFPCKAPVCSGRRCAVFADPATASTRSSIAQELNTLIGFGGLLALSDTGTLDASASNRMDNHQCRMVAGLASTDYQKFSAYRKYFLSRKWITYQNLKLYVLFQRYQYLKTYTQDIDVFRSAVILAGNLTEENIGHLYAPLPDRNAFVALVAARLAGVGITVHARGEAMYRKVDRYGLRELFRQADAVVTGCRYNSVFVQRISGQVDTGKFYVIREGVDCSKVSPKKHWRLSSPVQILCVANLEELNGIDVLFKACATLRRSAFGCQCRVVGCSSPSEADYLLKLKRVIQELNLETCISLHGPLSGRPLYEIYRSCDMFVLPRMDPGDGNPDAKPTALIESMAMQLPVISTRTGGIPEIIEHNTSGLLVPPDEVDALVSAIGTLSADSELRERLGVNARLRVREHFDLNKNTRQLFQVFQTAR